MLLMLSCLFIIGTMTIALVFASLVTPLFVNIFYYLSRKKSADKVGNNADTRKIR